MIIQSTVFQKLVKYTGVIFIKFARTFPSSPYLLSARRVASYFGEAALIEEKIPHRIGLLLGEKTEMLIEGSGDQPKIRSYQLECAVINRNKHLSTRTRDYQPE